MGKLNQNYANFFSNAVAAGFGSNEIISFMQNLFQNPASTAERSRLKEGQSKGTLRPDEVAAAQSHHDAEFGERALKGAAGAASIIGGAGFAATKLPGLLQKGLGALGAIGATTKTGSQPKTSEPGDQSQQPTEGFDPLAGLAQFPELLRFIQSEQSSGGNAQSIASKARKSTKLRTFVETIEQKANEPFENLLARLLGTGSQQQTQQNSGDDALMAAFDRILKM